MCPAESGGGQEVAEHDPRAVVPLAGVQGDLHGHALPPPLGAVPDGPYQDRVLDRGGPEGRGERAEKRQLDADQLDRLEVGHARSRTYLPSRTKPIARYPFENSSSKESATASRHRRATSGSVSRSAW